MDDHDALDLLTARLYAAFDNIGGKAASIDMLYALFLNDARIVKAVARAPESMPLHEFVESRRAMLSDGSLIDFEESELDQRTEICGHIASRWSLYRKTGRKDGVGFALRGLKSLQFVRVDGDWKIASLVWDDERPGLRLDDRLPTLEQRRRIAHPDKD